MSTDTIALPLPLLARAAGYPDVQAYGRALLAVALHQGETQAELASRLARTQGTVSRWHRGRRPIPSPVVAWLARRYG